MLGGVNGTGVRPAGLAAIPKTATTGYGVPGIPVGAAEHRRYKSDKREDCLTERSEGVPQRPFCAEERRAVGAKRRPSLRGALSFAFFSLGKQRKEGRARSAERIKNSPRAQREQNPRPPKPTANGHTRTGERIRNSLRATACSTPDDPLK